MTKENKQLFMSELWESIVKREIDKYLTIIIVIIMNTSSPVDPGRILDPGQCSVIVLFEHMRRSQETRLRNICSQKYSKVVLNVFFSVFCFAALFSFFKSSDVIPDGKECVSPTYQQHI